MYANTVQRNELSKYEISVRFQSEIQNVNLFGLSWISVRIFFVYQQTVYVYLQVFTIWL